MNDRPLGPKHLACFKHGIDVGHSGRTMAARRKEHQPDKSAVGECNISTDHGIIVSGYEGESIIIRTVCFIFIKTRAEILQLHNFSAQSPCFTMHSVHYRTICFMTSE